MKALPIVNKTDKVYTLDMDGNAVHSFQGNDWNNLPIMTARETLKAEGAYRFKRVDRRGETRSIEYL